MELELDVEGLDNGRPEGSSAHVERPCSLSDRPYVSVVLPVYNEAPTLRELYQAIVDTLEKEGKPFEVIFCDDGSTDGSPHIMEELAQRDSRVKVVRFVRNFGQTAALDAGFRVASGEVIVPMDADMQNDPRDIPRLLSLLERGYDVVSGWRVNRNDPYWTKVLPSRVANVLVSAVTGVKLHDYGCTLKAYRAEVLGKFRLYGEMHRLIPAYVSWAGGRVTEEPVSHRPRQVGRSKYTLTKSVRLLLDLLTVRFLLSYSTKPLYFIGKYGFLACGAGGLGLAWSFLRALFGEKGLEGSPLFFGSALLLLLGVQLLFFGLLAELNMRIYFESQHKLPYLVKETRNLHRDTKSRLEKGIS